MIDRTDGKVDGLKVVKVADEVGRSRPTVGGARLDDLIPCGGGVGGGEDMVVAQDVPLITDLKKASKGPSRDGNMAYGHAALRGSKA